jgi:hypothetical protein
MIRTGKRYLLVEHTQTKERIITAFSDTEERMKATLELMFLSLEHIQDWPEARRRIDVLAKEGILKFEEDPPIEWIEGELSIEG